MVSIIGKLDCYVNLFIYINLNKSTIIICYCNLVKFGYSEVLEINGIILFNS